MPAALLRRAVALSLLALLAPALPTVAAPAPASAAAAVRSTSLLPEPVRLESGTRLVGVTWNDGTPDVTLRWHTAAGWGPWLEAHDDSATPAAAERRGAVAGTEPAWRPRGADLVQVRLRGNARGARLVLVGDGGSAPRQRQQTAYAERRDPIGLLGDVGLRADWGADESMRDGAPSYAERVEAVVVHHTVQTNDYTEADVPAMIRADYAYHVRSRGWTDLGYNMLVDRFGRIWEGRAGGIGSAVIGSHAQGFNTGTLGVAYLGDASSATPSPAVVRALGKVAAYAAVTWRFDPAGSVVLTSRGSPKYASGRAVQLPRVFGHQDTGATACPGKLQGRLGDVRSRAKALVGPAPRITETAVSGTPLHPPAPMSVTARLSREAPWTVAVTDPGGAVVARTEGESTEPRLLWDGMVPLTSDGPAVLPAPAGTYRWTISVDDGWHLPAERSETFEVSVPLVPVQR